MKAALFQKPHVLDVVNKDLRKLLAGEVLVKVEVCGVCGTDLHIVEGKSRSTPPVVLGHEYIGVVEEVGERVDRFRPGQRVAIDPNISCGGCVPCRRGEVHLCSNLRALGVDLDGGMAEYSIVPQLQLYPVPATLTSRDAAFIEPVSCIVHGIDRARLKPGDTAVIVGAGTIGLLMLQLMKSSGASRIIVVEPLQAKQEIARSLGAEVAVPPAGAAAAVRELTEVGADIVIECVGKQETIQQAIALARRGGTVEFFGVCPIGVTILMEPNEIYFRELTILGSYLNPKTFPRAIELLATGVISTEHLPISAFPLDGVHEALAHLREGKTVKSIIRPGL